jgi:hypothetical protein
LEVIGSCLLINPLFLASCLLLSAKANDLKNTKYGELLEDLVCELHVNLTDILEAEFSVFSALEFSLHIPSHEYFPHLERLFFILDYSNVQEYVGERMYLIWKRDTIFENK